MQNAMHEVTKPEAFVGLVALGDGQLHGGCA